MAQTQELLKQVMELWEAHRESFGQRRVYLRVLALFVGELFAYSTHRVTDLLRGLGLVNEDWSSWYRVLGRAFKEEATSAVMLRECVKELGGDGVVVSAIDTTQVPRTGRRVGGASWQKNPRTPAWKVGIHWAQRFLNGCVLLPLHEGHSRAIPLRWLPAFSEKAVPCEAPACKDYQAGLHFVQWLRQGLNRLGLGQRPLLVLADGSFDKVEFWGHLPAQTWALVRTAKNRVLKHLPGPAQGKGRRRAYGDRAPAPHHYLSLTAGWGTFQLPVRGRQQTVQARVEGPFLRERLPHQPLFLIVVRGQTWRTPSGSRRRDPVFYLVNAQASARGWILPLPLHTLLTWAWQRWEVEVVHKEVKSLWGLGHKQCWSARAAFTSVQWSAWQYGLLCLAAYRALALPHPLPQRGLWYPHQRRWTFLSLLHLLRAALSQASSFSPLLSPSPTLWARIEHFFDASRPTSTSPPFSLF